jgi:hypothetical protein
VVVGAGWHRLARKKKSINPEEKKTVSKQNEMKYLHPRGYIQSNSTIREGIARGQTDRIMNNNKK